MRSNGATQARTYIHQTLQVVDVDVAQHVGFAKAEVRRSKYPYVKEIVVDSESDGVSALLIRSKTVDSL